MTVTLAFIVGLIVGGAGGMIVAAFVLLSREGRPQDIAVDDAKISEADRSDGHVSGSRRGPTFRLPEGAGMSGMPGLPYEYRNTTATPFDQARGVFIDDDGREVLGPLGEADRPRPSTAPNVIVGDFGTKRDGREPDAYVCVSCDVFFSVQDAKAIELHAQHEVCCAWHVKP